MRVTLFYIGVEPSSKQRVTFMIHTNNLIIKHKAGLLNLAEELSNVSKACKVMGVSREIFYRYKELLEIVGLPMVLSHR